MTNQLSSAQAILLRRIAEVGDHPFEIAPRARATARILADRDLLDGSEDLWRITDAGRVAVGFKPAATPNAVAPPEAETASTSPPRADTKAARVIEMLGSPDGVTIAQIAELTSWQRHSVRGFLAGALKKKHGMALTSEPADGGRRYRLSRAEA
jgi:hypothetical protein